MRVTGAGDEMPLGVKKFMFAFKLFDQVQLPHGGILEGVGVACRFELLQPEIIALGRFAIDRFAVEEFAGVGIVLVIKPLEQ